MGPDPRAGGRRGILSADREMLQRSTLIQQIADTGVVAVYLPKKWSSSPRLWQAAHILFSWPRITEVFATSPFGSAWLVPSAFSDNAQFREVRPMGDRVSPQGAS